LATKTGRTAADWFAQAASAANMRCGAVPLGVGLWMLAPVSCQNIGAAIGCLKTYFAGDSILLLSRLLVDPSTDGAGLREETLKHIAEPIGALGAI
jgi:hypothetical protein